MAPAGVDQWRCGRRYPGPKRTRLAGNEQGGVDACMTSNTEPKVVVPLPNRGSRHRREAGLTGSRPLPNSRTSASVKCRHFPICSSPMRTGPMATRTNSSTLLPAASSMRRTCRLRPSVIVDLAGAYTYRNRAGAPPLPGAWGHRSDPRRGATSRSARRSTGRRTLPGKSWEFCNPGLVRRSPNCVSLVIRSRPLESRPSRPTNRNHPLYPHPADQIVNGGPALLIGVCRNVTLLFVECREHLFAGGAPAGHPRSRGRAGYSPKKSAVWISLPLTCMRPAPIQLRASVRYEGPASDNTRSSVFIRSGAARGCSRRARH